MDFGPLIFKPRNFNPIVFSILGIEANLSTDSDMAQF